MKVKCVVVDDEPLALDLVCNFVNKTGFLVLEAKFDSALDALSFINANTVDLIFLDIQMSDLTGMELARVLEGRKGKPSPKIIFTTAYNQFAIEGYKVDALDYLLKPFGYEEFLSASQKALKYFEQQTENKNSNAEDYLFLKVEYQLVKVMLKDIILVEGYKDYVKVHLEGKESPLLSLTTLKNMEELLPENQFMRVHRSFIISLEQIKSISKSTVNMGIMNIGISEGYKERFLQFIGKWIN
ncbi:LytTR family DNA-binding domain-containing protein [Cyclobacterium sp. 1_MG-2023]|uniref:LytR/AlgR family response regulator transcription factor n=1 Tax=Cyclobacterium sp. 1_MG-2023 TaxID=3062681 RepID=UPI0026E1B87A|nr:LytTR family DNA-binding domain-containing protein [Cyclobacterium sp. 1_MG-2023]MDO6439184.1 LytTR family DNA-binding domain-containing protein [Cyclobacterium sp. 1_MG-2023]